MKEEHVRYQTDYAYRCNHGLSWSKGACQADPKYTYRNEKPKKDVQGIDKYLPGQAILWVIPKYLEHGHSFSTKVAKISMFLYI